jgi:hypothetical protein
MKGIAKAQNVGQPCLSQAMEGTGISKSQIALYL